MTLFSRTDNEVQLYFDCHEKMDRITRMCKYINYEDMSVVITTLGETGLLAKHRIKFGKGWMGKGAEIQGVDYLYGGPKGITIFITISESVDVIDCCIENLKDKKDAICLGLPTDVTYNWFHTSMSWAEWSEERAEERERRAEEEEIMAEMRIGETEMLEEMQAEAEMREALQGQVDY